MIIPFKLNQQGLSIGKAKTTIRVKSDITTAELVDRGYDFAIITDELMSAQCSTGAPTYSGSQNSITKRPYRLALNVLCMDSYNNAGTLDSQQEFLYRKRGGSFQGIVPTIATRVNDLPHTARTHVYIGDTPSGRSAYHVSQRGLPGVPNPVKESWKTARRLVRLTIDRGSPTDMPTGGIKQSSNPQQQKGMVYYYAGPINVLGLPNNTSRDDGARYTATTVFNGKIEGDVTGSALGPPQIDGTRVSPSNQYIYTYDRGDPSGYITEAIYENTLESSIYFEGADRDFAITPIYLNDDGSVNLVSMDNHINRTKLTTSQLLEHFYNGNPSVGPNPDPNPDLPTFQGGEDKFVKI